MKCEGRGALVARLAGAGFCCAVLGAAIFGFSWQGSESANLSEPMRGLSTKPQSLAEIALSAIGKDLEEYYRESYGNWIKAECMALEQVEPYEPTAGTAFFSPKWLNVGVCKRDDPPDFSHSFENVTVEGDGIVSFVWYGRQGGQETIAVRYVDPRLEQIEALQAAAPSPPRADEASTSGTEIDLVDSSAVDEPPAEVSPPVSHPREPFEEFIEFRNPQAEVIVRNFILPCPNKRQVTLMDAVERPVREAYSKTGRYLYTTIDSRGDEVRIYHQIRGHDGFLGPNRPVLSVNTWGDIQLYGVTMSALLVPCYM